MQNQKRIGKESEQNQWAETDLSLSRAVEIGIAECKKSGKDRIQQDSMAEEQR